MNPDLQDFELFMKRREEIARSYASGNPQPLARIVTHEPPATFFAPSGGRVQGAQSVASAYERDATLFHPGGESRLEVLQMGASDGLAFWTGLQHATVHLRAHGEPVTLVLRVTEAFRREDDEWRLVHRHADTLVDKGEAAQK